jgi:DNA modification methylase
MILVGDCREQLRTLADQSVHTCVTSPPYFGLRDYGHEGQMGLEPTPDEFVAGMVAVFAEVRRVLRDDGTLWLNIGDSYNAYNGGAGPSSSLSRGAQTTARPKLETGFGLRFKGAKPKDLLGIPWMLAFALRADGWYLRQDIIWSKPNPMPESVRDRCTKAHEYLFLFSKSPKYYFDSEAMKEPAVGAPSGNKERKQRPGQETLQRGNQAGAVPWAGGEMRNRRSVWSVATKPFKEAHFATYPPALIEPCILAGAPEGGTVLDPFFGAGTTGLVAEKHGRKWIGCELNPEYAHIAERRLGILTVEELMT